MVLKCILPWDTYAVHMQAQYMLWLGVYMFVCVVHANIVLKWLNTSPCSQRSMVSYGL